MSHDTPVDDNHVWVDAQYLHNLQETVRKTGEDNARLVWENQRLYMAFTQAVTKGDT